MLRQDWARPDSSPGQLLSRGKVLSRSTTLEESAFSLKNAVTAFGRPRVTNAASVANQSNVKVVYVAGIHQRIEHNMCGCGRCLEWDQTQPDRQPVDMRVHGKSGQVARK